MFYLREVGDKQQQTHVYSNTNRHKFRYKLFKSFNLFNDLDKKVTGKYSVFMCKVSIKLR